METGFQLKQDQLTLLHPDSGVHGRSGDLDNDDFTRFEYR